MKWLTIAHPVQVARFGRADSKPRGAAHARTTTSSLRTAATSACNVGVWEDHRRPRGRRPAPVAPRDARRRSFYERVLERNLTEPGLGKAAKIGTEVR